MTIDLLHLATFTCALLALVLLVTLIAARHVNHRAARRIEPQRKAASVALLLWSETEGDRRMVDLLRTMTPKRLLEALADVVPVASDRQKDALFGALRRADAVSVIRRDMRNADVGRRIFLCELMEAIGDENAAAGLRDALNDGDGEVRVAAGIGLARLDYLPSMQDTLDKLGRAGRRSARLAQLFEEALPSHPQTVRELMTSDAVEPRVRVSAMQALIRLWDPAVLPLLQDAVANDEPVAVAAAAEMHWLPHAHGVAMLRRLLESSSTQVRRAAAAAASGFSDMKLLAPLERLADDPDYLVRHHAVRSARQLIVAPAAVPARAPATPAFGASVPA